MNCSALPAVDLRPTGARRQRSFAFSVAAAVGLNLVAMGVFAAAVARWQAPLGGVAPATTWITAVQVARAAPQPEPRPLATPAGAAISPSVAAPKAPSPPTPTPVFAKAPPTASDHGSVVRFYHSAEVDRPAEPDSDWNLDTAALDAAGVDTLVFDIFIGRDGEVIDCTILEPVALGAETRLALETRLHQTVLQPALRGGVAVASVRRIEVSVLPPTQ